MSTTNKSTEMDTEQQDPVNQPDSVSPVVNGEVEKLVDTEHSPSNAVLTDHNMASNSANQEQTNASNTEPQKSNEIKDVTTSSDPNESEGKDKVDTNKSGESTASTGKADITKTDGSISSPDQEEESDEILTNQTKPNTSHESKANSNFKRFETADISSTRYQDKDEADLLESVLKNATDKRLINRLLGCAYGQALGDAYGLATEFEDRERVDYKYLDCTLIPFPDYKLTGHNRRWTRGDWTDDTDQWILILLTLMFHDGDEKVFARKLSDWIYRGYPELGDHGGMGLGANVSQVVRSNDFLDNPLAASEKVWERSNRQAAPNGAVMRCSASAFVHFNDREQVISTAELMCKVTHFDPRCIASCLAVCLAVTSLLEEDVHEDKIETFIARIQQETINIIGNRFDANDIELFKWFTDKRTLEELNLDEEGKIGYTYKCLASGFYGLRSTDSFEQTLHNLIKYGGDADTNGAVCGTLYGARHGYQKLPYKWLRAMPNKKWFDQILIKCFERMNLIEDQEMNTSE